ncbi:MAG TPA: hypothetical protein VFO19_14630 [Vicinamibacterales bacterium]|nr:hypothetical protein [Vicinamibacterales bacterium]
MTDWRDRPAWRLTRHFFDGLFDLGFLSDAGTDRLTRMILGVCAVFLSLGLVLTRIFAAKYAALGAGGSERYQLAMTADHAFMFGVTMWIAAFVTVLVSHSLFPDETDFRALRALPISDRLIFGAKLLALAMFLGQFIVAAQAALMPLAAVMAFNRWAGPFVPSIAAYAVANGAASLFAVLAVTALQGALLLGLPRSRLLEISAALKSALLAALVLALPGLVRLSARTGAFRDDAWWLYLTPPAWFVGLERWLLGDGRYAALAATALAAFTVASSMAVLAYAMLYRRFDLVLSRPAAERAPAWHRLVFCWRWPRPTSAASVVRAFTALTFRRSVMHQGVLVTLSAIGAGIAANSLIAAGTPAWLAAGAPSTQGRVASLVWPMFALIFVACRAARTSLRLPIEQRANWVFRITERPHARADQVGAAVQVVRRWGVGLPIAAMLPLLWLAEGPGALPIAIFAWLWGTIYVEWLMSDWGRLPFTCSYIPGQGFVPQVVVFGFAAFVGFTTFGTAFSLASMYVPAAFVFAIVALESAALWLRRQRRQHAADRPLEFEDQLPTEINPLRLSD